MEPPVSCAESGVTTPLTTDDFGNGVAGSKTGGLYTSSNLSAFSVSQSPDLGRSQRMAAHLPGLLAPGVAQLKEIGVQAGLQGKELADFMASRLSKREDLEMQLKEEEEKLAQRNKEEMEMKKWELKIREKEVM